MELFLLFLCAFPSFSPTLALSSTRCEREYHQQCSWSCSEVGKFLNFQDNSRSYIVLCDTGNAYTIGLCGDVHCKGDTAMACSNVTGPEMFLSNVTVTIDYNEERPDESQIHLLSDHSFFIALSEGAAENNACFATAADVYQAFLFVKKLPFVPPRPVTPPVGVIVGIVVVAVPVCVCIFVLLAIVLCCIRRAKKCGCKGSFPSCLDCDTDRSATSALLH